VAGSDPAGRKTDTGRSVRRSSTVSIAVPTDSVLSNLRRSPGVALFFVAAALALVLLVAACVVMKGFAADPNIAPFVDDIYAYLQARADGALARGRPRRFGHP
jgi:hypothetical protein